ncbi:glycosyl transferase [Metabacillus fastidiosus]|uniref:Glycosyl transferase n=1 Tax=Metabacillus fastidiosus TaxID=1458 RepID=A0ABU6NZA9_9BACI|nr:glycosyl transferase [Metabacillus fastidiosus]
MKKQAVYLILGIIIILVSTPLASKLVDIFYRDIGAMDEYLTVLNGFIYSLVLVGFLIFTIGIVSFIKNK